MAHLLWTFFFFLLWYEGADVLHIVHAYKLVVINISIGLPNPETFILFPQKFVCDFSCLFLDHKWFLWCREALSII